MKRIVPIFLLVIYLAGSGGIYYGYRLVQYYHFSQVRHLLVSQSLKSEMKLLVFNKEDVTRIRWQKQQKEFVYKDHMYDVARITIIHGKSYIYCYRDVKENSLISLFNQKKPIDQTFRIILSKILLTSFIMPYSETGILPAVSEFEYIPFHSSINSCQADIHSPPPKNNFFS